MTGFRGWKFEKRLEPSITMTWVVPVVSILMALITGGILLAVVGASPLETYSAMFNGAFASTTGISETLVRATPLILSGLSVAIAFRMLFWNIGVEGQLVVGGIAAAGVALFLPSAAPWIPQTPWVYLPLVAIAAIAGGALWGVIPALMKALMGVNEIITTLMFNYVAILTYQYLFTSVWKDPAGFGFPGSAELPTFTWLPRLSGRLNYGLVIAVGAAVLLWVVFKKSRWGYEIALLGENQQAARYAGISVVSNVVLVMIVSGGLAGLAGYVEVTGIAHRLHQGLAIGNGFTGIIVAWLAKLHPLWVVVVGVLLGALFVGGDQIQIQMGLPASVALVLQGLILIFVLGGDIFTRYRLRRIGTEAAVA